MPEESVNIIEIMIFSRQVSERDSNTFISDSSMVCVDYFERI